MPLRVSIHACLAADEALSALIGAGDLCRHYPERAKQDPTLPYVVSNELPGQAYATHGVPGDAEDTMDETLVQFTFVAATVAEAIALRTAARAAIMNDANEILATANIVATAPTTRFDTSDDIKAHGAQLDITFFHNPQT